MAKRTNQELDDELRGLFGYKRWSPLLAQEILARNESYDPPDDTDMLDSVVRLVLGGDIEQVLEGVTDMQHLYVTTVSLPDDPGE